MKVVARMLFVACCLVSACGGSATETPTTSPSQSQSVPFERMSNDQHLSEAKRLISSTATKEDIELAERHVKEVLKKDPANKEAQSLNEQAVALFRGIRDASTRAADPNDSGSRFTPAETFAMQLDRYYKQNGYDIDASVDADKALVLRSDRFKDDSAREAEAADFWNERAKLCKLEIWYLKVGYSKGVLSGDVMKTVSLGCVAQKAAYAKEMAPEREKAAAALSTDDMHASVSGTTLIFDSDRFADPNYGLRFMQMMQADQLANEANCKLAFTEIRLSYMGKLVRKMPLKCE